LIDNDLLFRLFSSCFGCGQKDWQKGLISPLQKYGNQISIAISGKLVAQ
jgi:hypothetical protein